MWMKQTAFKFFINLEQGSLLQMAATELVHFCVNLVIFY